MIELYNGYAIDIDDMNVMLGKPKLITTGRDAGKISMGKRPAYFNTVGKALDWFHELMIRKRSAVTR